MLVVFELDVLPLDSFLLVLHLFECEHVLVELLLQFLVCVVDAQLFERVFLENLEAKDVKQTDESKLCFLVFRILAPSWFCFRLLWLLLLHRDGGVDFLNDPAENRPIQVLGEGVAGLVCLIDCQRRVDCLLANN